MDSHYLIEFWIDAVLAILNLTLYTVTRMWYSVAVGLFCVFTALQCLALGVANSR